jgi:hypothetical protein
MFGPRTVYGYNTPLYLKSSTVSAKRVRVSDDINVPNLETLKFADNVTSLADVMLAASNQQCA